MSNEYEIIEESSPTKRYYMGLVENTFLAPLCNSAIGILGGTYIFLIINFMNFKHQGFTGSNIGFLLVSAAFFGAHGAMHWYFMKRGQSLLKWIFKMQIVNRETAQPIEPWKIILRDIAKLGYMYSVGMVIFIASVAYAAIAGTSKEMTKDRHGALVAELEHGNLNAKGAVLGAGLMGLIMSKLGFLHDKVWNTAVVDVRKVQAGQSSSSKQSQKAA